MSIKAPSGEHTIFNSEQVVIRHGMIGLYCIINCNVLLIVDND